MTTFAYPLNVKGVDTNRPSRNFNEPVQLVIDARVAPSVTGNYPIAVLPAGMRLDTIQIGVIDGVAGTSVTNPTLSVGTKTSATKWSPAVAVSGVTGYQAITFTSAQVSESFVSVPADVTLVAAASWTGGGTASAGAVIVRVKAS